MSTKLLGSVKVFIVVNVEHSKNSCSLRSRSVYLDNRCLIFSDLRSFSNFDFGYTPNLDRRPLRVSFPKSFADGSFKTVFVSFMYFYVECLVFACKR